VTDEEREGRAMSADEGAPSEQTEAELGAFMREQDWNAWKVDAPPADFAQRVVERAFLRRRPSRRARWLAAGAAFSAIAAALMLWLVQPRGEVTGQRAVSEREELTIGRRAVAVLEAGAELRWRDERVTQARGEVFYRVSPGGAFVVSTPAGSVSVLGTCFRVSVGGDTARVTVLEGRVQASAAGEARELRAGQSAELDTRGVQLIAERAVVPPSPPSSTADDRAELELSEIVSRLRERLGAVERDRTSLERELRAAQSRLAELRGEPPARHRYDLSREDWQELARAGGIKYRIPCASAGYRPSPEQLDELGLAPDDAEPIARAYAASRARLWQALRPLCADALGSERIADVLGRSGCVSAIQQAAEQRDAAASDEAMREASEIRAGTRPAPAVGERLHPVLAMFLALTAEPALFEAEIAQSLGPEDARRVTFNDVLCREQITLLGPGPRKD
jgi:hypothetical protein